MDKEDLLFKGGKHGVVIKTRQCRPKRINDKDPIAKG